VWAAQEAAQAQGAMAMRNGGRRSGEAEHEPSSCRLRVPSPVFWKHAWTVRRLLSGVQ
jgi:hypothetical protein